MSIGVADNSISAMKADSEGTMPNLQMGLMLGTADSRQQQRWHADRANISLQNA